MAVEERDPHSGYLTTGHEWNGIKELNTPVPRAVYFFLIATALFAVGYWILMPTWPLGVTYTKGLLGIDQRVIVSESLKEAALDRASVVDRIASADGAAIQGDPQLMAFVRQTGRTSVRRQLRGLPRPQRPGRQGIPDPHGLVLALGRRPGDDRRDHPRRHQFPASGEQDIADARVRPRRHAAARRDRQGRRLCAEPVGRGRTAPSRSRPARPSSPPTARPAMATTARERRRSARPDLTDKFWIYGGDLQSVFDTVWHGRQGHMPTWEARLSAVDRKILALYLVDLRSAGQ